MFLFPYLLFSVVAAWVLERLFVFGVDRITTGFHDTLLAVGRPIVFVGTFTAVGAKVGMDSLTKRVRRFKRGAASAVARLDTLTKGED